jgi:hypothetical protein
MNPYLRAAARNEALRLQALEKLQARQAEAVESIETVDVQVIERARDSETGQFLADDPTTPDVDEAWVVVE